MSNVVGWSNRVRITSSARGGRAIALLSIGLALSGGLAGCSGDIQGEGAEVGVTSEALTWSDGTTVVTVDAEVETPVCTGAQGQMGVTGSFTTNATVTIAMVVAIDGVTTQQLTVVTPGNFTPSGRDFVASFGADADVPNGMHRVDVCFGIVTTRGLSPVRACLPSANTNINCDDPPPPPMDMVPPTIMGEADPAGNAAGWNNTNVTVSFTCTDADSGVASCSAPTTLSMEGANQSVTGTATDVAGNSASATVSGISIDKTAPSIAASRSAGPNAAGWNNAAVTVSFACNDALSGVGSCSAAQTLASEGMGQSASGTAMDVAGNTASVSEGPINIDMTAPTLSVAGGGVFYVDENVNATCMATDALSGVASTTCGSVSGAAYQLGVGTVTLAASATDNAGNVANGGVSVTIKVDADSLCHLVQQFASSAAYAKAPCALLHSAEYDLEHGYKLSARIKLLAFQALVSLLRGIAFSSAEVAILKDLAGDFIP